MLASSSLRSLGVIVLPRVGFAALGHEMPNFRPRLNDSNPILAAELDKTTRGKEGRLLRTGPRHLCSGVTVAARGIQHSQLPEGALHAPAFLSTAEHAAVLAAARRISDSASASATGVPAVQSRAHNINSREAYATVELPGGQSCDHFESYAEGHKLSYFRGASFPDLGVANLRRRVHALAGVAEAVRADRARAGNDLDRPVKWRLTVNIYPPGSELDSKGPETPEVKRPGFPWHRDLRANGAVSVILGLGAPATVEFGDEYFGDEGAPSSGDGIQYKHYSGNGSFEHPAPDTRGIATRGSVKVCGGDVLVLSGSARWDLLHRVVPERDAGLRASLVFGLW